MTLARASGRAPAAFRRSRSDGVPMESNRRLHRTPRGRSLSPARGIRQPFCRRRCPGGPLPASHARDDVWPVGAGVHCRPGFSIVGGFCPMRPWSIRRPWRWPMAGICGPIGGGMNTVFTTTVRWPKGCAYRCTGLRRASRPVPPTTTCGGSGASSIGFARPCGHGP